MSPVGDSVCRVCGEPALVAIQGFETLKTVTSDCRPCAHSAPLFCCEGCGAVQKVPEDAWRKAVSEIYAAYEPYHQAGGNEQHVFDASGASQSRSERFLSFVLEEAGVGKAGAHLDIGCGNGQLLGTMHRLRPDLKLSGHELGEAQREAVCSLDCTPEFHSGSLAKLDQRFDLITMVHVLEHVEAPTLFLEQATRLLKPGAAMAVEVPNYVDNPFDLLVFDHCVHFDVATLAAVASRAGLAGTVREDQVPKELSAVLRQGQSDRASLEPHKALRRAQAAADWLVFVRETAVGLGKKEIGIFGTAIAATWLAGELGAAVTFFVDENPAMQGRTFMGRPVHAPGSVPHGAGIAVPLAPVVARSVGRRLSLLRPDCELFCFERQ